MPKNDKTAADVAEEPTVQETAPEGSTETEAPDTVADDEPERVHIDNGVGGRFVSLGGGERVRVKD